MIESFKYESKRKKLTVVKVLDSKLKDALTFKTDAGKLKLMLSNLLSNAIKFSFEEGIVEIECSKNVNTLVIQVRDYGKGISKDNQEIIFDRFKKLDSGINSINRGHGLGLSIVKAFIDLLEGSIDVKSSPGKGSAFKITIPESEGIAEGLSLNSNEVFFEEDMH